MKILLIAGQFYPDLAGSGIATSTIAKIMSDRGHDVTVCVDSANHYVEDVDSCPGFNIAYIPEFKDFMTGRGGIKKPTNILYSIINDGNFDIIHVFSYMPMLLISLMGDIATPVFFTFWNAPDPGKRALGMYDDTKLDLALAREIITADRYIKMILGSKVSYDSAISLGANLDKTVFRHHGIDMTSFYEKLYSKSAIKLSDYYDGIDNTSLLTLLPGRIVARKGVFEAVRAMKPVINKYPNVKLLLTRSNDCSDEAIINQLKNEAKTLNIGKSILVSKKMIENTAMPLLYKAVDLVITPSYYEGLGLTAIEALAAGKPLVATSVVGLNEFCIDKQNCLLIPSHNSSALADSIINLIENNKLKNLISSNAPSSVKLFDMKLFVNYLINEYNGQR